MSALTWSRGLTSTSEIRALISQDIHAHASAIIARFLRRYRQLNSQGALTYLNTRHSGNGPAPSTTANTTSNVPSTDAGASSPPMTVRGIANLGNTCFLNSILQSLATLSPFVENIRVTEPEKRPNGAAFSSLVLHYLTELQPQKKPPRQPLRPTDLHELLHKKARVLQHHEQQDAEELLQIMVNIITEELKRPPTSQLGLLLKSERSLPEEFRNPLAGWLASSLQCCRCHYRKPIRNSAFIDVPLTLPEAQGKEGFGVVGAGPRGVLFNGNNAVSHGFSNGPSRGMVMNGGLPKGGSSSHGLTCHLMECLKNFATEELVEGVECANCARLEGLEKLEEEINRVKENVAHVEGVRGAESVSKRFKEELARLEEERKELLRPDVDEEARAETGMKGSAVKRLVFSRLPTVLTLHLCRRVFSPVGRMMKIRQKVTFPLLMDMSSYAAYGGRVSDQVAESCMGMGEGGGLGPIEASSGGDRFKYILQSVIVHHGSADGGHYTTYRRLSTLDRSVAAQGLLSDRINSWVHVSDDEVMPVTVDEVLNSEAYLLFYQSLDSLSSSTSSPSPSPPPHASSSYQG